ncbi:Acetyltransferase (GNAT) family protein [Poriferisphaera corsica]|uniref:Acetyltransferase (GNAT) family protein n=1 Tax=Poriferisphaera corsica TaxID=2528020 RepID=A0A517YUT0_9BACT|nr:GNAT family N-acetyltransferase [Poriferisphaera corsica]QDU34023.1 Acetyltransferase (GNAT) family protein [Poriferisphaera corsica]
MIQSTCHTPAMFNTANINNLTSLWQTAAAPFNKVEHTPHFSYLFTPNSDWPNRLWLTVDSSTHPIKQSLTKINQILPSIPAHMTISFFNLTSDHTHEQAFLDASFTRRSTQTAMVQPLHNTPQFPAPHTHRKPLNIIRVNTPALAHQWSSIYPHAFKYQIPEHLLSQTYDDIQYYLALHEDAPVGTAVLHITHHANTESNDEITYKIAGIHCLGIHPDHQRNGFARQLMHFLLNQAISQNATHATLQASDVGLPLYQSLHFTPQFTIQNYQRSTP